MLVPIVLMILVASACAAGQSRTPQLPPASASQPPVETPWPPAGVYRQGAGVTTPRLIKPVYARYLPEALRKGVQGSVMLEAVVQSDGTVGEVRITRSLDRASGMDEEAVECLKKWQFEPGKKDDVPVPVVMEVEMSFTLGKKRNSR
jgi:periplasmic protein TonB